MEKKRRQNAIILIVLLVLTSIGGFVYWLWVKSIALPVLGVIEDYEAVTITDEPYTIEDGKIKLVTFVDSGCPEACQDMFSRLDPLQQDLVDKKAYVARAVILSIVKDEADKEMLLQYLEKYNVEEQGWKILVMPEKERTAFIKSIEDSKQDDRELTLVDATGKIRQHYNIADSEEKEQLLDDVRQLIRIQQQSIEERR